MVRFIHPLKRAILCTFAALSICQPLGAKAAGFEELHRFPRFGKAPSGIVRGPNGDLYGVTETGGFNEAGTLYRISGTTGAVETLANFSAIPVASPSPQIAADAFGNVYGLSNFGTRIWRWNASTGLHVMALLSDVGLSGTINGVVLDTSGGLIGTATSGGANGAGVLWRWHAGTGVQKLGEFAQATTGLTTKSRLAVDNQGAIYGCSDAVGGLMILWRWKFGAGFEKLAELPTAAYGTNGLGVTIDGNNRVWGVTSLGGAQDDGTLWRWSLVGGLEKLADFNPAAADRKPTGPLVIGPDGSAFGASALAVWRWSQMTGLVRHADLPTETVGIPEGAIAIDDAGVIYGASSSGGTNGCVWKCSVAEGAVKLQDFASNFVEQINDQGVARDAEGRIYGTTTSPSETVETLLWRWSDSGGYEELASFPIATFSRGATTPFIDADGNVYGIVEPSGFANPGGRLWRWNQAQGLVKLADFDPAANGMARPVLVLGSQGQVYGTCANVNSTGSIWRWTAGGGIENMAAFDRAEVVFSPNQITGPNGNWYGIQALGGPTLNGRLWSFSESTGLVFHHNFDDFGGSPRGVLTRDAAGNIYGTRGHSPTTLWKWNSAEGLTTLDTFDESSGFSPISLRASANGGIRGICERARWRLRQWDNLELERRAGSLCDSSLPSANDRKTPGPDPDRGPQW